MLNVNMPLSSHVPEKQQLPKCHPHTKHALHSGPERCPMYITTTAVVFSESLKTLICLGVIFYQKKNPSDFFSYLYESLVVNWKDTLMLSVPSIVYMVQNNLQYFVAVSNLEAAVFQVHERREACLHST